MAQIISRFTNSLRFETEIRGHQVVVDNPVESGGTDTGPTPPELVAAALGTCVGIYAVHFCRKHNISPEGMAITTEWTKALEPTRIGTLHVRVELPAGVPVEQHAAFMRTVEQCLVHNTLRHPPEVSITLG